MIYSFNHAFVIELDEDIWPMILFIFEKLFKLDFELHCSASSNSYFVITLTIDNDNLKFDVGIDN
ncbi:MAG: hypothetical protein ABIL76_02350 [candidate division WOR-3 bacterium]